MLDFSEKKNGGTAGQRCTDHRDISFVYDDVYGTDALIKYMNEGNIRVMPECAGIELSIEPTQEQYNTIAKIIKYFAGGDNS